MTAAEAPGRRRPLLVVAHRAEELDPYVRRLRRLAGAGHRLRVGYGTGPVTEPLERLAQWEPPGGGEPVDVHQLAARVRGLPLGRQGSTAAARWDPWLREAASDSELVVLVDAEADRRLGPLLRKRHARARPGGGDPALPVVGPEQVPDVLAEQLRWDQLATALAATEEHGRPRPGPVVHALQQLAEGPVQLPPDGHARALLLLTEQLARRNRHATVRELTDAAAGVATLEPVRSGLAAVRAATELTLQGEPPADVAALVAPALDGADATLAAGDLEHATVLASAALGLLFHRELHVETPDSELVREPRRYLAPLADSAVWSRLTAPVAAPPDPRAPATGDGTRVVLLPGAYGRFAPPVAAALRAAPDVAVDVLDLSRSADTFRFMAMDPDLVGMRLHRALGEPPQLHPEHAATLRGADVVVADWADKGAVWASLAVPKGTRLVVRLHGVDALAPWLHLVDWTRVDDLVVVSGHMADLVQEALGDRLAGTRVTVVPHAVDTATYADPQLPGAEKVLGMVGWGRRVKDPLWTVEVLAELLRREPGWRLRLVGAGFERTRNRATQAYQEQFARRVAQPDVRDHVEDLGEREDVPAQLREIGFLVSSSLRESFHLAVLEGAAAGAVPVVRDWPVFADRGGARSLYPQEWVVDSVTEAADRIWALREEADRQAAATRAREAVAERFDQATFERRIREVVLR